MPCNTHTVPGASFTAIAMLLRFAQFVNDNWKELTCP